MIKYFEENEYGIITLNRPEKRNALHTDMVNAIILKLQEIKNDSKIKVLIITGEGKSFCAGADLSYLQELQNYSTKDNEHDSENLAKMFLDIYNFPKPTIASVNGAAIAGGCGLATVCDFIIANNSNSKFGYSEVKIGFVPAIVSIFLIKKAGEKIAKRLLMTGDTVDGKTAFDMGLVDFLSDHPLNEAKELAKKLIQNSPYSLSLTKRMIQTISNMNVESAVEYCVKLNTISRSSEDFQKGIKTFLNN